MKPLVEAMDRSMLSLFRGKPKVIMSELKGADAAVLGASALGWGAEAKHCPGGSHRRSGSSRGLNKLDTIHCENPAPGGMAGDFA